MNHDDGREIRAALEIDCDVAVVGSGPGGAAVARALARSGAKVAIVEEGRLHPRESFSEDGFTAMAALYRGMGGTLMMGRAPIPYLQGVAVGGTSVVNGAISWRLPEDVHREWTSRDPGLGEQLSWQSIEEATDRVIDDLHIAPTAPEVAGVKNLLMARGAEAMGLAHRPISRNVNGCQGLGRCLQGCPIGAKTSMERTYLPDAVAAGARLVASVRVERVLVERGVARGIAGVAKGGGRVHVRASRAVVVAASAIQTPILLIESGIRHGPVGENLMCHPGASVAGRFAEPVRAWTGATQGHEVTGLRGEGIKLEVLGFAQAILAMRLEGTGAELAARVAELEHWTDWGAAIRAKARGVVRPGPRVRYQLGAEDLAKVRRGVRVLGEMLLAAGATEVTPGVHGFDARVTDRARMSRFEDEAPHDARAYPLAVTHLFGTCRMGTDPATSVVRPDFRHHTVDRLYITDSSIFPTNTGVNPQTSILALSTLAARRIAAVDG